MRKLSDENGGRLYVGTDANHVFIQCEVPMGLHIIPLTSQQARELSDYLKDAAQFMDDIKKEADDATT